MTKGLGKGLEWKNEVKPKVLILVEGQAHKNLVSRNITGRLLKSGDPFTVRQGQVEVKDCVIEFRYTETLNRNHESLYGRRFENYFLDHEAPTKPTERLLEFIASRLTTPTERKGVPAWLVDLLIGLNLT